MSTLFLFPPIANHLIFSSFTVIGQTVVIITIVMFLNKLKKIGGYALGIGILVFWIYIFVSGKNGKSQSAYGDDGEYQDEHKKSSYNEREDGTQSATVDYYNPETGHSATYDLDVDVEDGEVSTIHFPNGGYLDESHITPAEIDEDGNATIEDDRGRTFDVHIEDN